MPFSEDTCDVAWATLLATRSRMPADAARGCLPCCLLLCMPCSPPCRSLHCSCCQPSWQRRSQLCTRQQVRAAVCWHQLGSRPRVGFHQQQHQHQLQLASALVAARHSSLHSESRTCFTASLPPHVTVALGSDSPLNTDVVLLGVCATLCCRWAQAQDCPRAAAAAAGAPQAAAAGTAGGSCLHSGSGRCTAAAEACSRTAAAAGHRRQVCVCLV